MRSKLIILITILITTFAFSLSVSAGQRGKKKQKRDKTYQQERGDHKDRGYKNDHRGYHKPPKWNKHRRHNRRHIPNYYRHPHWKRWSDWDRHYKKHPRRYPGGKYHYDRKGDLMFSYCDPDTGNCFSFSFYF